MGRTEYNFSFNWKIDKKPSDTDWASVGEKFIYPG